MAQASKKSQRRPPRRSRIGPRQVDSEWFKEQIRARGLSIRRLANEIGYDYSVLQNIIAGKRSWHAADIAVLATRFGVGMDEVWRRAGINIPVVSETVPILGWVDSSGSVTADVKGLPFRVAPRPLGVGDDTVALYNLTPDSQATDGWVFYHPGLVGPVLASAARLKSTPATKIEPTAVGRLALVKEKSGKMWVRVLWRNIGPHTWVLRSLNEGSEITVEVAYAVPIVWVKC